MEGTEEGLKIELQGNSVFFFFNFSPNAVPSSTCRLLTKREVKMAGYISSIFFFCVFMDRDSRDP